MHDGSQFFQAVSISMNHYYLYADDKPCTQKLNSDLQSSSNRGTSKHPEWLLLDKLDGDSPRSYSKQLLNGSVYLDLKLLVDS